jgi:hypothetical protein
MLSEISSRTSARRVSPMKAQELIGRRYSHLPNCDVSVKGKTIQASRDMQDGKDSSLQV